MRIYFLGICGTAMGNAALLAKEMGHEVIGSDEQIYPPMSDLVTSAGITLLPGYDAERLNALKPDLVVIGNALSRGNVEIEFLLNSQAFACESLPGFLKKYILQKRNNIVVSGTHGKTTTATIAAYIMERLKLNPGYLIGGVPKNFPSGSRLGDLNAPFVIEGDEYDSAFFDKRSKFIHYNPKVLIINNIELDHTDIFRDIEDIKRSFRHLTRIVPQNGVILINGDDANVLSLLPIEFTQVFKVGLEASNDLIIKNYQATQSGSQFELHWQGKLWMRIQWQLHGLFNARNAAMAILATAWYMHKENVVQFQLGDLLMEFQGVKRRKDVLYADERCVVVEDFGHHPTAIMETLDALKVKYPDFHTIACLEPRSYTSCTKTHQEGFRKALQRANRAYITSVYRGEKYSPEDRLDTQLLASELTQHNVPAMAFQSHEDLFAHLLSKDVQPKPNQKDNEKCLIVLFTNGAFGNLVPDFLQKLREGVNHCQ